MAIKKEPKKLKSVKMERNGAVVDVKPENVDNFTAAGWTKCL
jgi:hypothetical protein